MLDPKIQPASCKLAPGLIICVLLWSFCVCSPDVRPPSEARPCGVLWSAEAVALKAADGSWRQANAGDRLYAGDVLKTGVDGRATVWMAEPPMRILVDAATALRLGETPEAIRGHLLWGSAWAEGCDPSAGPTLVHVQMSPGGYPRSTVIDCRSVSGPAARMTLPYVRMLRPGPAPPERIAPLEPSLRGLSASL